MATGATSTHILVQLAGHHQAIETLETLEQRPHTFMELRTRLGARRRSLGVALRALAANDAVRRHDHHGSWDHPDPPPITYELTSTGRQLARQLDHLDVWVAIYEHHLYGPAASRDPDPGADQDHPASELQFPRVE